MEISGMVQLLADTLTSLSGKYYAFWSPLVGEIGTFITGSGTSANILFGKLQVGIAVNMNIETSWLAAANTTGTTAGKIISPQSIAIAASACQLQGQEGNLETSLPLCTRVRNNIGSYRLYRIIKKPPVINLYPWKPNHSDRQSPVWSTLRYKYTPHTAIPYHF